MRMGMGIGWDGYKYFFRVILYRTVNLGERPGSEGLTSLGKRPIADTGGVSGGGVAPGGTFGWAALAKHTCTYIFNHKNIGALVEVHVMVK